MKTKLQIELETAYNMIMTVLKNEDVCLINQGNKKTLEFFKSSSLWLVKDGIGITISKHFLLKDALKEFMKI